MRINKLIKLLVITIICITLLSIHGIIQGNGTQSTIYLKVANNWELYTISSNYKGYTCKLIVIDSILTVDNYKDISIINIKDINSKHSQQANETIQNWNSHISNTNKEDK
jgi:hypothetical protein